MVNYYSNSGFRGVVRNMTVNYHSVNLWKQDNLRDYNVPVDIYNVGNVYLGWSIHR